MVDLSIIIVSYNTKDVTEKCLLTLKDTIRKQNKSTTFEIIVVDNASEDQTEEMLQKVQEVFRKTKISLKTLLNSRNLGYAKANNQGAALAEGRYLLFLNSDVIVGDINFSEILSFMDGNTDVGVLTVRLDLLDGGIDPASHRGFPTLWRSFCYFFGLERLFGKIPIINRVFGGYHLTYTDLNKTHEIDSPTGAFYLIRKGLFTEVGRFNESFFMYGEDLDLSYRIKQLGKRIIYFPKYRVIHLKYQSGLRSKDDTTQKETRKHFYDAMRIFYDKHYAKKKPQFVNALVYFLITKMENAHEKNRN
ncbi:glycosyltransferase family 2 protein [Candidatus Roizmanbacteria bacterium]|nr:glycosyltransferase family 2 protein [Candidatus Roizmanbacteria bacterium]